MQTMSRRAFLGATAGALAAPSLISPVRAQNRPNFLFILADDLGWADLGCYGNTYHESPHIDRLASEGMRFRNAYAACPVCSPTRASLMSGQYPARVGITDFIAGHWRPFEQVRVPVNRTQYLPEDIVTFAEALGNTGYACGSFGKWHLGEPRITPGDQGFDDYVITTGWGHFANNSAPEQGFTEDNYLTEELADLGIRFMEKHRDESFCLYISHFAVHIPLEARQNLILKYANKPRQDEEVCNPVYAAMIDHLDQSVGKLLDALDRLELADNTVVIFYSDNGGLHRMYTGEGPVVTSNAPLRGEKGTLYEGGIREPLIVRWPGMISPGTESDVVVTTPDFYPTLLELADVAKPDGYPLDGVSLAPVFRGERLEREAVYWHYPHYHHSSPAGAVRQGDWKLIEFYDDNRLELYNLLVDIGETENLAQVMPDKAAELQQMLAAWRDSVGAEMPTPNPDYDPDRAHEWGKHPGRG